jgi:hypothetical protein
VGECCKKKKKVGKRKRGGERGGEGKREGSETHVCMTCVPCASLLSVTTSLPEPPIS